ncbi:MAG: hypothetical protein ACRDL0_23115, partial [Thermoleophilaceae bacterium]
PTGDGWVQDGDVLDTWFSSGLFHADAPNDVAPSAYNEDDPPGGLPASPLAPRPEATGFRWAA